MDGYLELALAEYDYSKGYDATEIYRCISLLREHLEFLWGVDEDESDDASRDDDRYEGDNEDIPLDFFAEEGLDAEDIDLIIDECREMMEVMLEGMSPGTVPVQPDHHVETQAQTLTEPELQSQPELIDIDESLRQLECYRGTDQQRTPDWYAKRRQMITASSSHKILKVDIPSGKGIGVLREKILPPPADNGYMNLSVSLLGDDDRDDKIIGIVSNAIPSNPDAPNIRGQRYEPIIRRMYERKNNVVVEEYDCITHPKYPFLGASPDGVITKGANLGRMTEIKCPNEASAIKDGLQVRDEYWSQMQLQMEVCNLPECDYVRAVVRDTDTISGIQQIIQGQVTRIRTSHGFDESAPLIAASGTIWMGTDGKYVEEADGKFVHENTIHLRYGHRAVFIRHYVIFWKDVFIKTVYRDRSWFQQRFLPKAIECWAEIQRGLQDPDAWNEKYPLKRRGKRAGAGGGGGAWGSGGGEGGDVCLLMDD